MAKTSISVPEMQRMLGMKKVEAYWLVKQGRFKTVVAAGHIRVMLDSFEDWYSGQFHYKKVDGPPPGQKWGDTMSVAEVAELLGRTQATVYDLMKRHPFRTLQTDNQTRIYRDSFEDWYQSQSHYIKRDEAAPPELRESILSVREAAAVLGVHRNSVYALIGRDCPFEVIKLDGQVRIDKSSFESWYRSQPRYRNGEKRKGQE